MAVLDDAIQGRTHSPAEIVWTRKRDGKPQNLTGATISAVITDQRTGASRAATGAFAVTDAANGVFTWTYSAADVATAGVYYVQFTATYSETSADSTYRTTWEVKAHL